MMNADDSHPTLVVHKESAVQVVLNDEIVSDSDTNNSKDTLLEDPTWVQRQAMRVARNPCMFFWISFILALGLGVIGMITGGFSVGADTEGWNSRGTLIANRHTQFSLIDEFKYDLHTDTSDAVWMDLLNNVQKALADDDDGERRLSLDQFQESRETGIDLENIGRRLQSSMKMEPMHAIKEAHAWQTGGDSSPSTRTLPRLNEEHMRLLQSLNETEGTLLEGCDVSFYSSEDLFAETHLWPIWRTNAASSFFDASILEELCLEEQVTQRHLEEKKLCHTCGDGTTCLQPYSPVFYARLVVEDGMKMSCEDLAATWEADNQDDRHSTSLQDCYTDLMNNYNVDQDGVNMPESCPYGFFPTILDEGYISKENVIYTSSIFATRQGTEEDLFDEVDGFARGRAQIEGVYDTQQEDFVDFAAQAQLGIDMSLALGSAFITCVAMMIHTKSLFLTLVGILQITLSFPLAFFFYTYLAGLEFFPFLNFIGVFVLFALGADDVFVAVDKWKNARIKHPDATTEEIASLALPDAAMAMFLTTLTTSVAFFGTAVCPVAPILCFAVFVGMMVIFDYIMCVLLVFPALCIYDRSDKTRFCCNTNFNCCKRNAKRLDRAETGPTATKDFGSESSPPDEEQNTNSGSPDKEEFGGFVHKLIRKYYKGLLMLRYPLILVCAGSLIWCAVVASQIELPSDSDVRIYDENDNQYEQNYVWRKNILFSVLEKKSGSEAYVVWGTRAKDTGDHNNPETWSQLVLDNSFVPSNPNVQTYLRDFCDRFFEQDFATKIDEDFVCPINAFDAWLQEQAVSTNPDSIYTEHCNEADGLPMPETDFDACIYNWGQQVGELSVVARQGKVEVMYIPFTSRVRYDSTFDQLNDEWNLLEDWMEFDGKTNVPEGGGKPYFTSEDFWWYDTTASMLKTAYQSAAIAMAAAAGVILFSSRSFTLTLFATITVGYVLVSVVAMLVALGWTLGFLESILFAILIGISCDFIIHFAHAYAVLPGQKSREDRTLFCLLSMGPSILAAAFTTFAAACVMLGTVITFFEKFAVVLFVTVIQALLGSFVVFLTMAITMGPSEPTYLVDRAVEKCRQVLCRK